ncbi:MAG: AraC family transcriptional regulator, partial [Rhizorhabdus sp.]|nr:AraC family transcriptional regulator [Rhizorhabdus sp.]
MHTLSELLSSMRLSGGVFLDGVMRGPWSILSELRQSDCAAYFPTAPSYIIAYHYVRTGSLFCQIGDGPLVPVQAGEIVILPRNLPHFLHGPDPDEPVNGRDMLSGPDADGLFRVRIGGSGAETSIYCGFLGSTTPENMLLRTLPPIMVIALDDARESDWIRRSLEFAVHGLSKDSPETVGKLAEGLFAEAVRRYIDALPPGEGGWLAGLGDPAVGRTIALIHSRYADALSLDTLAREAGVSKTVLGDRFRALLGESPMQYCAKWRMHVAADMLRKDRQNAGSVAYSVGFNSEAAFNRAFKR